MRHPDLEGLKALWNIDENILNEILNKLTDHDYRQYEVIGVANAFLSYMDGLDTDDLAEAWAEYDSSAEFGSPNDLESNPFL